MTWKCTNNNNKKSSTFIQTFGFKNSTFLKQVVFYGICTIKKSSNCVWVANMRSCFSWKLKLQLCREANMTCSSTLSLFCLSASVKVPVKPRWKIYKLWVWIRNNVSFNQPGPVLPSHQGLWGLCGVRVCYPKALSPSTVRLCCCRQVFIGPQSEKGGLPCLCSTWLPSKQQKWLKLQFLDLLTWNWVYFYLNKIPNM